MFFFIYKTLDLLVKFDNGKLFVNKNIIQYEIVMQDKLFWHQKFDLVLKYETGKYFLWISPWESVWN